MGEIIIDGEKYKAYSIFVDERNNENRAKFIEFLEDNGYNLDKGEKRSKDNIIDNFLPIEIDPETQEYCMMGNVTCAAAAASKKVLISTEEFCQKYMD